GVGYLKMEYTIGLEVKVFLCHRGKHIVWWRRIALFDNDTRYRLIGVPTVCLYQHFCRYQIATVSRFGSYIRHFDLLRSLVSFARKSNQLLLVLHQLVYCHAEIARSIWLDGTQYLSIRTDILKGDFTAHISLTCNSGFVICRTHLDRRRRIDRVIIECIRIVFGAGAESNHSKNCEE